MDEKSPDAFRTISEAAEELDLPQHVLRFWESRFREIKPMKRGGGRRFYRPDDLDLLRGIRHLLYGEGYTIRGVQRILREQGIRFVQEVWQDGAVQPPHGQADDEEGDAEVAAADGAHGEEPSGLGGRFGALIGRDLDERDGPGARREPPLTAAPMPRLTDGDRAAHGAAEVRVEDEDEGAGVAPDSAVPAEPAPARRPGLATKEVDRLRAALQDLTECRRLIDAAVARPD